MSNEVLFSPATAGCIKAPNRIVLAPMTRARSAQPGDIPTDLMAYYYAQRASAGFLISEATQISAQGKGYSGTPGIYTRDQIHGWRKVTTAVHAAHGQIFCQLWHVGRMSHPSFHPDGLPVAPSAIAPGARVWVVGEDGVGRMEECPVPRALATEEIPAIVEDFRQAAVNADQAGFNGVEIHGANGYLIDQFLRRTSNQREDAYGGPIENRIRFAVEVVTAVCQQLGPDRVGIRLAPFISQRGMNDPEAIDAILAAAKEFEKLGIAYIHLAEADWDDAPAIPEDFRHQLRERFSGAIVVAGNYTPERGAELIEKGLVNFVAFGRKYLANPDLPVRLHHGFPLNELSDPSTVLGGGSHGYTDYPTWSELLADDKYKNAD